MCKLTCKMKTIPICNARIAPQPPIMEGTERRQPRQAFSFRLPHYWGLGGLLALLTLLALPALAAPDLPNFHPVAPGIWRGAVPSVAGMKHLKALGIKTIIDLRISPRRVKKEGEQARALGFQWINLPMGADPPTSKQVAILLATLKTAPQSPVFVHCEHGADRTGCMIGIYRETQQGWTFPQAYAEMRRDGFDPRWTRLRASVQKRAPNHGTYLVRPPI